MTKILTSIAQWVLVCIITGILIGSISALFLVSLDSVTSIRELNFWIVLLLPIGGLVIGFTYHFLAKGVAGGNNRLIAEMIIPKYKIHWKMTPLVLFGTLATHLFGGSAGREGTAVQMGGATADQFSNYFKWGEIERKIILRMGIAAGFSSVFGTPIAGILFAYELGRDNKLDYKGILPIIITSFLADFVCHSWNVEHTQYVVSAIPPISLKILLWAVVAGLIFGLAALTFNYLKKGLTYLFEKTIKFPPLRPFAGGLILVFIVFILGTTKYLGLGVPIIQSAFITSVEPYDFIIKLILTALTLGAGFKGGEATPLFFIGATLGNVLIWFIPLPMSLLAGMGFIALFAGATNTPLACIALGIELFGIEGTLFFIIACGMAFIVSGKTSVYTAQQNYLRKYSVIERLRKNSTKYK